MAVESLRHIYQLKVTLMDAKPPIWRRLLVSNDMPLNEFHNVIQIAMGWMDCHLHQFVSGQTLYGMIDEEWDIDFGPEKKDENGYRLSDLLKKEKETIIYEYDFGDGWAHKVLLEKKLPYNNAERLPKCIKGKRACPPEDCGGVWGYEELQQVIKDPKHPEYKEMMEWLVDDFDPEAFDVEETNEILREYFE